MNKQPTFDEIFTFSNLVKSAEECCKGVRWKQSTQAFEIDMYSWCSDLYYKIHNGTFKTKGFTNFYISERGKTRFIQSVHISERTVQKCLTQYGLKPILVPSLIYDNAASLKGKGTDFAIKRLREHLQHHFAIRKLQGGILIGDFHDYFHSINHEILLNKLREKIKDNKLYEMTKYFIDCFPGDTGLGLGSEISQICAIYYLNEMDHKISEQCGIEKYARFMDDFYVINDDIETLKNILNVIVGVAKDYKIELNKKRTHIYAFSKFPVFTYLKCKTTLSDSGKIIMRNVPQNYKTKRHLIKKQKHMIETGIIDNSYAEQSLKTWRSYALKRKQSFQSVHSICDFYANVIGGK